MPLPEGVHLTKKGRRICEHLDAHPHDSITQIMEACDVSARETVVRWRNYWRACDGDWSEAPPPTVQHRVDTQDPMKIFGPPPEQPKPDPAPDPVESDPTQQEKTDPEPPSEPDPEPPRKKSPRELIF